MSSVPFRLPLPPGNDLLATLNVIWKTLAGQRLRYAGAIAALVVASCFFYLAPLVPQAVLDGVILDVGRPSIATRWVVDILGDREFLADNLWLSGLVLVGLTSRRTTKSWTR